MKKSEKYKLDLGAIQNKIRNLQNLEFNLQQKIERLEKFPELDTELVKKQTKEKTEEEA